MTCGLLHGTTVIYQRGASNAFVTGYNGITDVTLSEAFPGANFGDQRSLPPDAGDHIFTVGRELMTEKENRTLLRWDLASFSGAYAAIESVTLTLQVAANGGAGTLSVHSVSDANRGWVEGNSAGGTVTGASTWNHRLHGGTPWAGSAGLSTPGVDYAIAPWFAASRPGSGAVDLTFEGSSAALTQLIDSWTNPSTNAGLLLTLDGSFRRFQSSEAAYQPFSPKLTIQYTPVPEPIPAALLGLAVIASGFGLAPRGRREAAKRGPQPTAGEA